MKLKSKTFNPFFTKLMATWFGLGMLPKAPGTWGSLGAIPMCLLLNALPSHFFRFTVLVGFLCFAILMSVEYQNQTKTRDPQEVVIDEVIGMMITVPFFYNYFELIAGFVLFRLFDVLKPYPISILDKKSKTSKSVFMRGAYIVLDDVGAGIYAAILLLLIRAFVKF